MRGIIYDAIEKFQFGLVGPLYQRFGRSLLGKGLKLQGSPYYDDRLVASLRGVEINGVRPKIGRCNFIAPNAAVFGEVTADSDASIWYGAILKGEKNGIQIGSQSVVLDNVRIRTDTSKVVIGRNAYIGSNATLNSCTIEDGAVVGAGAKIGRGAVIEKGAMVAAGAIVGEGVRVPSNQVWAGNPAKYLRDITAIERDNIRERHGEHLKLAEIHYENTEKPFREWLSDVDYRAIFNQASIQDDIFDAQFERQETVENEDMEFDYVREKSSELTPEDATHLHFEPYEQDFTRYPASFKKYEKNYEKYKKYKEFFDNTSETAPKFINHESEYKSNEDNWTDRRKY